MTSEVATGLVLGVLGLVAGLWTTHLGSRSAEARLEQERRHFDRQLTEERSRSEREISEARQRTEVELAEQRRQRVIDRRAEVYVDLIRTLAAEDDKIFDAHPHYERVRPQPLELPTLDHPALEVKLTAFASPAVIALVREWKSASANLMAVMERLAREKDFSAQLEAERERDFTAEAAHNRVVEIQDQVRAELAPSPDGSVG